MELNIWFEGQPRTVCNVTRDTSCHDVIMAVARTAGLPGRYTLVLRWPNGERPMAPNEPMAASLSRAPQHAELILQRTELTAAGQQHQQQPPQRQNNQLRPASLHTNGSGSSNCSTSSAEQLDAAASENVRRQLKQRLLMQEHEIEMNRLRIEELDKELRLLQLSCQSAGSLEQRLHQQEAELQQLSQANLADCLAQERQLHDRLQAERRVWDKRLTDVNLRLAELRASAHSLQVRSTAAAANGAGGQFL
ncbi:hypothetical protein BOX15_Mlig017348g1 [Macrostomum lignano]|uniref:Ras-associating domain-containing protein n=1 Tax=Macrostomum lignano TaxID=282301 RepID=A0A267GBX4_9PLAT|nr:hypothetical protein BOX15_Mlig017348g1 [Macrostomum lignano]